MSRKRDEWFVGFDRRSGANYYYNANGDVTYEQPEGFRMPSQATFRRPSFLGGGNQSMRLQPIGGNGNSSSSRSNRSNNNNRTNMNTSRSNDSSGSGSSGGSSRAKTKGDNWFKPNPAQEEDSLRKNRGTKKGTPLRVLYAHTARYEDELTLRPGQIVIGIQKVEGGTWWYGELNGMRGHFPANFVEVIKDAKSSDFATPKARQKASTRMAAADNYGASSSGWFAQQAAPQRPPKPQAIAVDNVARPLSLQLKDEKKAGNLGNPLRWTFLAHNYGYCFALFAIVTGGFAVFWFTELSKEPANSEKRRLLFTLEFSGPLVFGAGVISFLFEYFYGLKKTEKHTNYARAMMYTVLSGPCFTSYVSIITGIIGLMTAGVNILADQNNERGTATVKNYIFRVSCSIFLGWSFKEAMIMIVFTGFNVALFLYRFFIVEIERQQCLQDNVGKEEDCITAFAPFAKGFGTSLDFTCAFIVIPVLRAFIRKISNVQVGPTKTLATVIPIKKALQFHKMIGFAIFLGSLGHIFFHFINFALAPEAAIDTFGSPALWTGGILTLLMVIIFCGAHDSVRRSHFEAFWYSHQAFLLVFPFCLSHGPKYWYAALIPIPLYALDRLIRARRGTKPMYVDYVRYQHPVLKLHFFPEKREDFIFRAGQYLYMQCPHVNDHEWHPFTISSSPGDLDKEGYVSLHIRVQAKGSWTHEMKEYFRIMSGAGGAQPVRNAEGKMVEASFESYFTHFDNAGVVQRGKLFGPDALPLIRIDGPHSAPAQTYSFYQDVMLVGSGIGLTPSAAILSDVTRYKWAKGFQPNTLRFYWVVRHSEIDSFEWFIELLTIVTKRVLADRRAGALTMEHRLEINIYVTSVPSSTEIVRQIDPAKPAMKNKVEQKQKQGVYNAGTDLATIDIGFSMSDLKKVLKNPTVSSKEQIPLQYGGYSYGQLPNRLGDIWIWNGRPEWDTIFPAVRDTRQEHVHEVGVLYCGAPIIGKDLKEKCRSFSGRDCAFTLNKEVF